MCVAAKADGRGEGSRSEWWWCNVVVLLEGGLVGLGEGATFWALVVTVSCTYVQCVEEGGGALFCHMHKSCSRMRDAVLEISLINVKEMKG